MKRNPESHKGENGKVAIVGGSRLMHGAPLFASLAAEASGADLLYVVIPRCHEEVAKNTSLNFQVHPLYGDEMRNDDRKFILELLASMDSAVLGPGIMNRKESIDVLEQVVAGAACPLVLDATSLQPSLLQKLGGKPVVLTPHLGELERMGISPHEVNKAAKEFDVTIFVKGQTDRIISPNGKEHVLEGGNAGLTVGGTGDVLAGLICGLIAQKYDLMEACICAGTIMNQAGSLLFEERGYAYTAHDVLDHIPLLLNAYQHES